MLKGVKYNLQYKFLVIKYVYQKIWHDFPVPIPTELYLPHRTSQWQRWIFLIRLSVYSWALLFLPSCCASTIGSLICHNCLQIVRPSGWVQFFTDFCILCIKLCLNNSRKVRRCPYVHCHLVDASFKYLIGDDSISIYWAQFVTPGCYWDFTQRKT